MSGKIQIRNKKAFHDYHIGDRYVAGIELYGTEIKSIRAGKASIKDAFCVLLPMTYRPDRKELWIKMHIAEYSFGNLNNHEPRRNRKLLLKRRELKKIDRKTQGKGTTIIPLKVFINERGLAKVEIAIAQGKKMYDKRQSIKEKDTKREFARTLKHKLK